MVRETNVDTGYPIFIPLRVAFVQFCHLLNRDIFSEVKICTDAGLIGADITGGDIDGKI